VPERTTLGPRGSFFGAHHEHDRRLVVIPLVVVLDRESVEPDSLHSIDVLNGRVRSVGFTLVILAETRGRPLGC
jgi:hypothetical protein